jgi:type I restriction enzyme, S subunit
MIPQTFFANFGHVANAPEGVNTLRQLVMASALAGKYSAPNETLPSDIQSRLAESRSLHFQSSGKREKPLLFGTPLIQEFKIPVGWQWVRVGQICDLQTGATPSTQRAEYWGGEIPWLASGDVNRREIFECDGRITEEGLANSNCKILPINSVLVALNGQGKTRATVALLRIPAACNQSLVAMIPYDLQIATPEYLYLSLRYRYYEIRDVTGQDQRRGLNMGLVSELSIPLAPLAEQMRIVAKTDELMALCDQLEAQQQERERRFPVLSRACHTRFVEAPTAANLKRIFDEPGTVSTADLRRSILTLAVGGHLVPDTSFVEPELVGNHVEFLNGYAFKSEWFKPSGIKLCRNVNVSHGILDWREPAHVSEDIATEFERFTLQEGDIVLSLDRPIITTGLKVARVRRQDLPCLLLQRVAKPVPKNDRLSLDYFYLWLQSPAFIDSIDPGRSNGVPHISTKQLQKLTIRLPPPAEQRRIVAKADVLMALVDELEAQQQELDKLADAFAKACVASFTGTNQFERSQKMKAPKTELISIVTLGKKLKPNANAPLAKLLSRHKGTLPAKSLWQQSGLAIDVFYQELKEEIAQGWIARPAEAEMKVLEGG